MSILHSHVHKETAVAIDARVKLIVLLVSLIMVVSYKGVIFPSIVMSICLMLCVIIGVPLRAFLVRLSEALFIAGILVVLKLLSSGTTAIFSFPILGITFTGYEEGLIEGAALGMRIMGAVSLLSLFGLTTSAADFAVSLAWLKVPKTLIEVLLFAMNYIFILHREAVVIYSAQKNRLGYSSVRQGLNSFGILSGSLILKAFEHSQNTAVAMAQRGYDGTIPMMKQRPFRRLEIISALMLLTGMGALWIVV